MSEFVAVPLDRGLLLCRDESNQVFVLNESAKGIWETLHSTRELGAASEYLAVRYGLPEVEAERTVARALGEWLAAGLFKQPKERPSERGKLVSPQTYCGEGSYEIFGQQFRLRFFTPEDKRRFHLKLAHLEARPVADTPIIQLAHNKEGYQVCVDSSIESASSANEAVGLLARSIVQVVFPDLEFYGHFHAAAVDTGASILLLPGIKGSGKTTLSLALHSSGSDLLCDDIVFLDSRLRAIPFPTRPCVKEGSWPVLESVMPDLKDTMSYENGQNRFKYITPPESALVLKPQGRHIRRIVFPTYRCSHPTRISELSSAECLQRLVEEGNRLSLKRRAVEAWSRWIEETPSFVLEYSSLDEAVSMIEEVAG
jgi:hypothetical protein